MVKSIADFFTALLAAIGFVGRPRRRDGIHKDLQLLDELEKRGDHFGPDTWAHTALMHHIEGEVGQLSGLKLKERKIAWDSVILCVVVGVPLGYLTYRLNLNGFDIWSLLPGLISGFMLLGLLGMITGAAADDTSSS